MASTEPSRRAFLNKHLSENYPNQNLPSLTEAQVNELVKRIESALNEKQKNKKGGSKDIPIKAQETGDSFWANLLNKGKPVAGHAPNKGKPVGNHKGTNDDSDTETESESESDSDDETPKKTAHAGHKQKPVINNAHVPSYNYKGPVLPAQNVPAKNNKEQNHDTETESDSDDETPKKTAHPVASHTQKPVASYNYKGPVLPVQKVPAKNNKVQNFDTETESDSD